MLFLALALLVFLGEPGPVEVVMLGYERTAQRGHRWFACLVASKSFSVSIGLEMSSNLKTKSRYSPRLERC